MKVKVECHLWLVGSFHFTQSAQSDALFLRENPTRANKQRSDAGAEAYQRSLVLARWVGGLEVVASCWLDCSAGRTLGIVCIRRMASSVRTRAAQGSAVIAAIAGFMLMVGFAMSRSRRGVLFSQPFDSDVPIQWDSSASVDLDGLSRYYSAATAHLRHAAPEAHMALKAHTRGREMQLVQLPRFEDLSSSWHKQHLRKWSPQHYMSVASSNVDATTAKGIWKSKDEAWSGIDKVLPTDTRYEYQSLHSGHGQEAKMMAFLDHAHHQLKLLKKALPKLAADEESKNELDVLKGAIEQGEGALEHIERDTVEDDAAYAHETLPKELSDEDLGLSNEFKVAHGSQLRQMAPARAHYESARDADADLDSFFASLDKATQRENRKNARMAGESASEVQQRDQLALDHSTIDMQQLRLKALKSAGREYGRRKEEARKFIQALSRILKPDQRQQLKSSSDSCGMCIAVMGCRDCCELFCSKESDAPVPASSKPVPKCPKSSGSAAECVEGSEGVVLSSSMESAGKAALEKEVRMLQGQVTELTRKLEGSEGKQESKRASLPSNEDILEEGRKPAATHKTVRMPCECTTQECKECPDRDLSMRVRRAGHAFSKKQDEAEREDDYADANSRAFRNAVKSIVQKELTAEGKARRVRHSSDVQSKTVRMPCECDDGECKNCPEHRVAAKSRQHGVRVEHGAHSGLEGGMENEVEKDIVHEAEQNSELMRATRSVAHSNDALLQRIVGGDADKRKLTRQGLGVYEADVDDDAWIGEKMHVGVHAHLRAPLQERQMLRLCLECKGPRCCWRSPRPP